MQTDSGLTLVFPGKELNSIGSYALVAVTESSG